MRIIYIINSFHVGGAEVQLVSLVQNVRKKVDDVAVLSLYPHEELAEDLISSGIEVHFLNMKSFRSFFQALIQAKKIINSFQPDVIHSHMYHSNIFSRLLKVLARDPQLVNTAHNSWEGSRFRYFLYRISAGLADFVSIVSQEGYESHIKYKATPKHKLEKIPNGIDTEIFKPDSDFRLKKRQELGVGDEFLFVSVGWLSEQKNYENALKAIAAIKNDKRINFRHLIIGKAPGGSDNHKKLEQMTRELNIDDMVNLIGHRNDVQEILKAANGYLSSSAWEGMPIVLLEAAASALPIVATDVGDCRAIVRDGVNGFLVPPRDHEELAAAMTKILELSPESLSKFSENSRKHIIENFSIDSVANKWIDIYSSLTPDANNKK